MDSLGNRYFSHRKDNKKRWVLYKGLPDASKISPAWHGWLHGNDMYPLDEKGLYSWQKDHRPNFTGTVAHYIPKETNLTAKNRPGYERWRP